MKTICPKCDGDLKCLSGESGANSLNWHCKDEKKCGWHPRQGNGQAKVIGERPQVRGW